MMKRLKHIFKFLRRKPIEPLLPIGKKVTPEEIEDKFKEFLQEMDQLNYQDKLRTAMMLHNLMLNYVKMESDKKKMCETSIELFKEVYKQHKN